MPGATTSAGHSDLGLAFKLFPPSETLVTINFNIHVAFGDGRSCGYRVCPVQQLRLPFGLLQFGLLVLISF